MLNKHRQEGCNLLRMVLVLCLGFCFALFCSVWSFRAWPKASKPNFRSFSCKSVFVFLSARNTAPCVSGPVYSMLRPHCKGLRREQVPDSSACWMWPPASPVRVHVPKT